MDLITTIYDLNSTIFDDNNKMNIKAIDQTSAVQVILMNHRHPIFGTGLGTPIGKSNEKLSYLSAKYVRKALNHILDKNWIKDIIYGGYAKKPTTVVSVDATGWNANLKGYEFNISQAKSYLEKAGYNYSTIAVDDNDGKYDNYFFELNLFSSNSNPRRIQYSNQFVNDAAKIGINVNYTQLNFRDPNVIWSINLDIAENEGYDLFAIRWLTNGDDWVPNYDYNDESIFPVSDSWYATYNWINYSNNTLSTLIQSYLSQSDDERTSTLFEIQDHFHQEAVHIPSVNPLSIYGLHCRAQGIEDLYVTEGQSWKGFKIDYSQCPDGVGPDPLHDLINSPATYLIVPSGASG